MHRRKPILVIALVFAFVCMVATAVTSREVYLLAAFAWLLTANTYRARVTPAIRNPASKHTLISVEGVIDGVTGMKPGPIVAYMCTDAGCDYWCEPHEMPKVPEVPSVVEIENEAIDDLKDSIGLRPRAPKRPKRERTKTYRHPRSGKPIRLPVNPTKQRGLPWLIWAGDLNAAVEDRDRWRALARQSQAEVDLLAIQVQEIQRHQQNARAFIQQIEGREC